VKYLYYKSTRYALQEHETVLECLLRQQVDVLYSCKSGVCQTCLMKASDGELPEKAQAGLKATYVQRKLFLACQCVPSGDLKIENADEVSDAKAVLVQKEMISHNVLKLCLSPDGVFECEPGQYLTIINPNNVARSYSIANNVAEDGFIELHIRLHEQGVMSKWLKDSAEIGDNVTIRGPAGNCFYTSEYKNYPIILAGTGTGLAPLYGIIKTALARHHQGAITLFHGALRNEDLYLVDDLKGLDEQYGNFSYVPCVLSEGGDLQSSVMDNLLADKTATRFFVCGDADIVNALKSKAFIGGLSMKNIYSDPFLPSSNNQ
jgi:CDP-4-dehydro-6-deoxyglucose reductase, E3